MKEEELYTCSLSRDIKIIQGADIGRLLKDSITSKTSYILILNIKDSGIINKIRGYEMGSLILILSKNRSFMNSDAFNLRKELSKLNIEFVFSRADFKTRIKID